MKSLLMSFNLSILLNLFFRFLATSSVESDSQLLWIIFATLHNTRCLSGVSVCHSFVSGQAGEAQGLLLLGMQQLQKGSRGRESDVPGYKAMCKSGQHWPKVRTMS